MRVTISLLALLLAPPIAAQEMDHSHHHGMDHGAETPAATPATPAADPHAGHHMPAPTPPIGDAKPPAPPTDRAADRYFPPAEMAAARAALIREHGGMKVGQVMIDQLEIRPGRGGSVYAWNGEAWFGGDKERFILESEGEGAGRLDHAEVQALWSRALDPYWNLQAGIRQDIRPRPGRTYAALGIEGLAPYWFEVETMLFISNKGDISARINAYYDQRITQRLILQPRIEASLAASSDRRTGIGSGLTDAEFGLRLRYEIERRFAPYVGITHERRFGKTRRIAVAAGEHPHETRAVLGIRAWF